MAAMLPSGTVIHTPRQTAGRGQRGNSWEMEPDKNLALSYLSAVLLHGVYDTCCMTGTSQSTTVFVSFVIAMYAAVFLLIRHESRNDAPV